MVSLEQMRAYLRQRDLIGGYIPQLALEERQSRWWTLFWFSVRRLDDLIDSGANVVVDSLLYAPENGTDTKDFERAMRQFVEDASLELDTVGIRNHMLSYIQAERKYLSLDRPTARDFFVLCFYKAYPPAYVGMRLLLQGEEEGEVRRYAKLVGTGFQFADDLIDFAEDHQSGRLWVTCDELEFLGISAPQCAAFLHELTRLRESICLRYFITAYDYAARFRSRRNRRLAELTIEQFFRCVQKKRFHVYPGISKNYYGFIGKVLPHVPGPEWLKYHVFHVSICLLASSGLGVADVHAIRRRASESCGLPGGLAPEVCLSVMDEQERQHKGFRETRNQCITTS
jgi:phytoene/squalene synthetase